MEKLNLKKFKDFKADLSQIYGGETRSTTIVGQTGRQCDEHVDTNNNGQIDAGEHLVIVEC